MIEMLIEVLAFALKALIVVVAIGAIVGLIASAARRPQSKGKLRVTKLNSRIDDSRRTVQRALLGRKALKRLLKADRARRAQPEEKRGTLFVVDFEGDMMARAVDNLRNEVTAILSACSDGDEVLVRIHSTGGVVTSYGLAASQLQRLRDRGLRLHCAVDRVAASGGYMMAVVADRILAAPFAVVGSIGVVAQVPNLHRFLERHGVDFEELTAGRHKRTVSLLGEITPEGREHFLERLQDTHQLFKDHVAQHRPQLDIEQVATGDYWFGREALGLGLIDEIATSDDFMLARVSSWRVVRVEYIGHPSLAERFSDGFARMIGGGRVL